MPESKQTLACLEDFIKITTGNKLGGDLGELVSLQEQTSPYFQLREKSKCIEYIGKSKFPSKTSPLFS